jgi:hypothetical protein
VCTKPGPSAATTAIASTGAGSDRNASVMRISNESIQPPDAPAISPTSPPIARPTATTTSAANQLDRAP